MLKIYDLTPEQRQAEAAIAAQHACRLLEEGDLRAGLQVVFTDDAAHLVGDFDSTARIVELADPPVRGNSVYYRFPSGAVGCVERDAFLTRNVGSELVPMHQRYWVRAEA